MLSLIPRKVLIHTAPTDVSDQCVGVVLRLIKHAKSAFIGVVECLRRDILYSVVCWCNVDWPFEAHLIINKMTFFRYIEHLEAEDKQEEDGNGEVPNNDVNCPPSTPMTPVTSTTSVISKQSVTSGSKKK